MMMNWRAWKTWSNNVLLGNKALIYTKISWVLMFTGFPNVFQFTFLATILFHQYVSWSFYWSPKEKVLGNLEELKHRTEDVLMVGIKKTKTQKSKQVNSSFTNTLTCKGVWICYCESDTFKSSAEIEWRALWTLMQFKPQTFVRTRNGHGGRYQRRHFAGNCGYLVSSYQHKTTCHNRF